jgi:hypothetical protein
LPQAVDHPVLPASSKAEGQYGNYRDRALQGYRIWIKLGIKIRFPCGSCACRGLPNFA